MADEMSSVPAEDRSAAATLRVDQGEVQGASARRTVRTPLPPSLPPGDRIVCRELFERAKHKYLDHIKNVQHDLHETRQLLEKDAAMKSNQDSAYQQLIDERRQLLTRYTAARSVTDASTCTASAPTDHASPQLSAKAAFYRQVFLAQSLLTRVLPRGGRSEFRR